MGRKSFRGSIVVLTRLSELVVAKSWMSTAKGIDLRGLGAGGGLTSIVDDITTEPVGDTSPEDMVVVVLGVAGTIVRVCTE
jgi:hypothetical protein